MHRIIAAQASKSIMGRAVHECVVTGQIGKAVITLAKELWVVKDRQRVLEAALADKGIVTSELLDGWEPDEALTSALEQDRAAFIDSLLKALERSS